MIQTWKEIIENHSKGIEKLILCMLDLHREYEKGRTEKIDIGFNVFTLSSDFYYRENFHSDIIKAFLDPKEKHNEGNKYLHIFIDLLNCVNVKTAIKKSDFENSIVVREKHNIDILIIDDVSKKAIIIENKINNAVDQYRQLPKYYDRLKNDYEVVAIVYLTLNSSKRPDQSDWTEKEKETISEIIKLIPAWSVNSSEPNIFNNWISQSLVNSENVDSLFLLKQYGKLLKFLNTNSMDTVTLEKFYESLMQNEDNYKTALSIRNMLNDLPEYLAIRIQEKYQAKCSPFKSVWRYKQRDTVFEGFEQNENKFKIDIWCDTNGYDVHFWETTNEEFDIVKEFQEKTDLLSDFSIFDGRTNNLKRHFEIKEEKQLCEFLDLFLERLRKWE